MKQLLILSIFLTSVFAQGQMQRKNAEDMEKMEMRKKRMEQLQDKKESTMIGIQTNYLDLSPEQAQNKFARRLVSCDLKQRMYQSLT